MDDLKVSQIYEILAKRSDNHTQIAKFERLAEKHRKKHSENGPYPMHFPFEIVKNKRGYWELWIDGSYHSNHDSHSEAMNEAREANWKVIARKKGAEKVAEQN